MKIGDPIEFDVGDGAVLKGKITWVETDPDKEFRVRATFDVHIDSQGMVCTEGAGE